MYSSNIILTIPGGWEWILVALAVLLLFGGKKIPELMKGLGQGMKEFKKAKTEAADEKPASEEKKDSIKE